MIPYDYIDPDWENTEKRHDWKNHVPGCVQHLWPEFTDAQQKALAEWAEALAGQEEWD